jgi:excisionase family DNA binding protein
MSHPIMTPIEVAEMLKIHLKTVYKLIDQGKLPANRIGRSWRFLRADVENLLHAKSPRIIIEPAALEPEQLDGQIVTT